MDPNSSSIELIKSLFEISLWLAIPIFIIIILLRAWRLSIVAGVVVILFGIVYFPYLVPRTPHDATSAPHLNVMTFNLKTTSEGIVDVIRSGNTDIVALQEVGSAGASVMENLKDTYPYQSVHPQDVDYKGQAVLSRFPIKADEYWNYPEVPHTLGNQRIEIDFNGTTVVIYNVHPWPPLGWESGYNDESHRVAMGDIAKRTFAETLPLLLLGDFNMTDNFEEYDLLSTHFIDSYRESGDSTGYTFPNYKFEPFPPLLRLDYIWHSNEFQSIKTRVWPVHAHSDHSPVVATLFLGQTP